jgi:hypothetical protein
MHYHLASDLGLMYFAGWLDEKNPLMEIKCQPRQSICLEQIQHDTVWTLGGPIFKNFLFFDGYQ